MLIGVDWWRCYACHGGAWCYLLSHHRHLSGTIKISLTIPRMNECKIGDVHRSTRHGHRHPASGHNEGATFFLSLSATINRKTTELRVHNHLSQSLRLTSCDGRAVASCNSSRVPLADGRFALIRHSNWVGAVDGEQHLVTLDFSSDSSTSSPASREAAEVIYRTFPELAPWQ